MAFRFSLHRSWPHYRFIYFRLYNWTSYIALVLSILAPLILLLNKNPRFLVFDVVYPVHFAGPVPRQHYRRYRALLHRICRGHFLPALPSRPPSMEIPSFLHLFRCWRALLAQSLRRSRLEKCLCGLVRWRQTLCRILFAPRRCRQLVAIAARPQESLPRPPNRSANSQV